MKHKPRLLAWGGPTAAKISQLLRNGITNSSSKLLFFMGLGRKPDREKMMRHAVHQTWRTPSALENSEPESVDIERRKLEDMGILRSFALRRRVGALLADRASIGVITAMTLLALCGVIGFGTDAAIWYSNAHRVQTMVETTALSAGRLLSNSSQTSSTITAVAKNDAMLNGFSGSSDTISVAFGPSGNTPPSATTVTVTVKRTLPLLFSGLFFHSAPAVTASATATASGPAVCIYVLGSGSQTLLVNSNFSLNAPNC